MQMGSSWRNAAIGGAVVVAVAVRVCAVDRYLVETPSSVMVGDATAIVKVVPLSAGAVDQVLHEIKFVGLPNGVRIDPLSPSSPLTVSGATSFRLSLAPSVTDRRVILRVQKSGNSKVAGSGVFNVDRTIARFTLTPVGMNSPQIGVPFRFQILALDPDGAIVTSYRDPVDLTVNVGGLLETEVPGEMFLKGVAYVDLTFTDPDPIPRPNRLEARARNLYTGQSERAAGSVELTVQPKAAGQ